MSKVRVATLWLDGCSGCHMSLLDIDQRLLTLVSKVDIVYSPLIDIKEFPEDVDLTVVEGGVSSSEDLEKIHKVRKNTKLLMALGDCAITGNVPSMRNLFPLSAIYERVYVETADIKKPVPVAGVPTLLPRCRPVHELVPVDVYLPGCPPPADAIFFALTELAEGRMPELGTLSRFGR